MARDIDRLIEHVRDKTPWLPPVHRQVVINRLQDPPTDEELRIAAAQVYPNDPST